MNTAIEPTTIATYLIQRLAEAGSPPTSAQVQDLLYFINATHYARHQEPAFVGQILKTHSGIRIASVHSSLFHINGGVAVPVETPRYQGPHDVADPQVVQGEVQITIEEVLQKHGGRSGWEMQQEIVASEAWKSPGAAFGVEHLKLELMAKSVRLERVKVGSAK